MRDRTKALAVGIGCICVVFICLAQLMRAEVSAVRYQDRSAAELAGALGPGKWLPTEVPLSAVSIEEAHDSDTNEVWFTYAVADVSTPVPSGCVAVTSDEAKVPDFDRAVRIAPFAGRIQHLWGASGVGFYRCNGDSYDYDLVFDKESKQAWAWSLGDTAEKP